MVRGCLWDSKSFPSNRSFNLSEFGNSNKHSHLFDKNQNKLTKSKLVRLSTAENDDRSEVLVEFSVLGPPIEPLYAHFEV